MNFESPELERAAKELHKEWDSPCLWPRIHASLQQQSQARRHRWWWMCGSVAAAALLLTGILFIRRATTKPTPSEAAFLTQQALGEVEKAESLYVQSIDRLARLVEPRLATAKSPLLAGYREKIALLDSAISELRAEASSNPYHAGLHVQLASLYRDKQMTLQEVFAYESHNR